MQESSKVAIFDGHNDAVQHLAEYREGGRDFLARSEDGHLDLPRAQEGGMIGGLFALFAKSERPPEDGFTRTADGYEVRLADPLDAGYARFRINSQLSALKHLVVRAAGKIRWATTADEIEAGRRDAVFVIVLHLEGLKRSMLIWTGWNSFIPAACALSAWFGAAPIFSAMACRSPIRVLPTSVPV